MGRILTAALAGTAAAAALLGAIRTERWDFAESDRRLDNPDRGFYIQVRTDRPDGIREAAGEVRLILLACDIEDCADGPIPEKKLKELGDSLRTAEEEGLGVIFRAAYGFSETAAEPEDLEQIGGHIRQLCQVLNDYQEQLLVVQAGMLGSYGEWHTSRFLEGDEERCRENRLSVLRWWEEFLDPQVKVAVRRPRFIREAAAAGVLTGRLGFHNDALLSTDSDMGTYDVPGMDREAELRWAQTQLTEQANGGEMPTPGALNAPKNADREFSMLHISYLNLKYNKDILSQWAARSHQGMNAKTYLENHLGYRLFLSGLDVPNACLLDRMVFSGLELRLRFTNAGYSGMPERYRLFLLADNGGEQVCQELQSAELYRISNGTGAEVELSFRLPVEFLMESERIDIGLKIAPDEDAGPRECVELANDEFPYRDGVHQLLTLDKKMLVCFQVSLRSA